MFCQPLPSKSQNEVRGANLFYGNKAEDMGNWAAKSCGAALPCATIQTPPINAQFANNVAFLTHQHHDTTHKCIRGLLPLVSLLLLLHLLPLLWFQRTLTVIAVKLGLPFLSLLSRLGLRSEGLQTRVIRMYGACQIMTLLVIGCFHQKNRVDSCIFRGFKSYLALICL